MPVVNSFNEWDPLEEVIVGIMDGSSVPPLHATLRATLPRGTWSFYRENGGRPFPRELVAAANRQLDQLARLLEAEGVVVRRPDRVDHSRPYSTPDWTCAGGLYSAMPRDVLLVVGDEIIEAPMPWRSRYHETGPYRTLIKEYFRRGARWSAAPRPQLRDDLFDEGPGDSGAEEEAWDVLNETEPVFDAADFIRCGRDILYIRSQVTNRFGVEWLRRHLGDRYRLHELPSGDAHAMHIDDTYVPLAPGRMLINPEKVKEIPDVLRSWELLPAPPPCSGDDVPLYMSSKWLSMNVLMLDERRVVVAAHEENLIRAFREWGFEPLTCEFRGVYPFGGSVHCVTLDVRRRGGLRSYF